MRLGEVNPLAAEEHAREKERLEALETQREDLLRARAALERTMKEALKASRGRFEETFDAVREQFQHQFRRLFGGGRADIVLCEADDVMSAGVEIMAQPPGKKPQVLTLLSGGEKALTALSLIFAVFLTNPSPICVLDEVDAPLDDTNVERFCRLLEDMAANTDTRFLVITHHPMTMARMDRLFGVTMAERGISQLVSVDLATAESYREAS